MMTSELQEWDQVLLHWQAGGDYGYTRAVHQAVTTLLQQVRQGCSTRTVLSGNGSFCISLQAVIVWR